MKYEVKWSDGRGAASRGFDSDSTVYTSIIAKDNEEALKKAYLIRAFVDLGEDIRDVVTEQDLKNAYVDYCGGDTFEDLEEDEQEEFNEMISEENDRESCLDDINMDGIDGGDPWIIYIKDENGNLIYDNTDRDIVDEEDIEARMNELPTEITIPKNEVDDWLDGDKLEDIDEDDIRDFINDYLDDHDYDVRIYDFDDWVGTIQAVTYNVKMNNDGTMTFSNIEYENNMDY